MIELRNNRRAESIVRVTANSRRRPAVSRRARSRPRGRWARTGRSASASSSPGQARRVEHRLAPGGAPIGLNHRQQRDTRPRVFVAVHPGDGQKVRHLPHEDDPEQHPPGQRQAVGGGAPADHRRQRARQGPDNGRERGAELERRIEPDVAGQGQERHAGGEQIHEHGELHQAGDAQHEAEDAGVRGGHARVGQRAQPCPPHQLVGLAFPHLVERRGAAGDERRADERVGQCRRRSRVGPER